MRTRADFVDALVGVTAEDLARDLDAAATAEQLYEAVHGALLRLDWQSIASLPSGRPLLVRVREARVRVGLTTSEATRTAVAREAEQRLMNERAARRAS
ncbi:MAG: hypothetical protein H6515_14520 [Microthrixaceae bacterium]|nr:hypothetical protein [Microthrixaceae bacterium]